MPLLIHIKAAVSIKETVMLLLNRFNQNQENHFWDLFPSVFLK